MPAERRFRMRSPQSLRDWMSVLLPGQTPCAQRAAWELVRALLVHFTTNLTQLARQTDRATPTRGARQFLARWLRRSQWDPDPVYAQLLHLVPAVWQGSQTLPLLLDCTFLGAGGQGWTVCQVSVPWQGRALPVYRVITRRTDPEWGQTAVVLAALGWLRQVLPGPHTRYVVVMDRGFPSYRLIQELQDLGWRYVLRINDRWKMAHPEFTGRWLREIEGRATARLFPHATLGTPCPQAGTYRGCHTQVVAYRGVGQQATWFLATSEDDPEAVVTLYRLRMQVESGFRDVKGPWGLDELAEWQDQEAVARFLAGWRCTSGGSPFCGKSIACGSSGRATRCAGG